MFGDLYNAVMGLMPNSSAIDAAKKKLNSRNEGVENDSAPNQGLAGSMKGIFEEQIKLECQGSCDASLTKSVKFSTLEKHDDMSEFAIYVGLLTLLLLLAMLMVVRSRSRAKDQTQDRIDQDKIDYSFLNGQDFSPKD